MRHTKEAKAKFSIDSPVPFSWQRNDNALEKSMLSNLSKHIKTDESEEKEFTKSLPYLLMGCAQNGVLENMTDVEIRELRMKERHGL